ncbi:MAG: FliM/FliN family flagellar motor switch protein [Pseudomonadota bacterium]
MSTGSDKSVIRRKAQSGREDFDVRAMSWSKAVRLSLERLGDRLFELQLSVRTVVQEDCALAGLKDVASGDRLVMLLDVYADLAKGEGGPAGVGGMGRGAAIMDRGLVQSLVEVQTRGKITEAELDDRPFTPTDAAVTAQLIDPVLASVDEMMMETPQSPDPLRLRYGDKVEDARALLLALEAPDYALFRISIDVEEGKRSGDMVLAIPEELLRPPPPVPDKEEADASDFDLSGMALSAPVSLNAVVARLSMPLSQVSALKPGDRLPVERDALTRTELVGSKGFMLGKVMLGQMNGLRAVRLGHGGMVEDDHEGSSTMQEGAGLSRPAVVGAALVGSAPDGPGLAVPSRDTPSGGDAGGAVMVMNGLPDLVEDIGRPPDLELPALDVDLSSDLSSDSDDGLDLAGADGMELADLADLSGLDDATLGTSDDDPPGLPDIPGLPSL